LDEDTKQLHVTLREVVGVRHAPHARVEANTERVPIPVEAGLNHPPV
jgi:hypothetical protein